MTPKQLITIASASLIIIGFVLGYTWTSPAQFFISVGMIVSGIVLFLLYTTFSVAGWADTLLSGNRTEISFKVEPEEENFKSEEEEEWVVMPGILRCGIIDLNNSDVVNSLKDKLREVDIETTGLAK